MTEHEPRMTDDELIDSMLLESIEPNLSEEENDAAVKAEFYRIFDERFENGEVIVGVKKVIRDHMWSRGNDRARNRTNKLLRDLRRGQFQLAHVDQMLNAPMVAGKGRKTTLAHINSVDLDRIVAERIQNAERAQASLEEVREIALWLKDVLLVFGSVGEAIRQGGISPSREEGVA